MKLEVGGLGLRIIPEDAQDEVYIEKLLKLKRHGQSIRLYRDDAFGVHSICGLQTWRPFPKRDCELKEAAK